jgi:hypothetical protein
MENRRYRNTFFLTHDQEMRLVEWLRKVDDARFLKERQLKKNKKLNDEELKNKLSRIGGCSGGRLTFCFMPFSIGVGVNVIDRVTKKKIDLSDYDNW